MRQELLKKLLQTAKGMIAPDCIIRNGRIVNVFTNSIDENQAVVIKDGFIVSIEEDDGKDQFSNTQIIDAKGAYLCPGFIDAHTHLDGCYPFYEFVPFAIRGGTTTVITECAMVACAAGMEGVVSFVESTKGFPQRCYFVAPPLTPPFPNMETSNGLKLKEFERLLRREDFLGIGEGYWTRVVDGDPRVLKQASLALSLNKVIDGHSAGARGKRLIEYILTGITSCHESITAEEALEKLRYGIYVMIREGFVRKELKALSSLKDSGVDTRRLILTSDFFDAVMLVDEGYVDTIVRRAIEYGFPPIEAIKMATINPADYLRLRHLGAIAPLRYADILFLKDIKDVSIERVMFNGEMVYTDGSFTKDIRHHEYPYSSTHTIGAAPLKEEAFFIKTGSKRGMVRVIDCVNPTITREATFTPAIRDGIIQPDLEHDIIFVAVINRNNSRQMGKGLIKGTGIKNGAVATTFIWDTCNILVIGSSPKAMMEAANRLIAIQGGIVIVKEDSVIYECPMPVYGLIPLMSMKEIRSKALELDIKMKEIGARFERPLLNIQTIAFTGLPFLRITDKGLVDIKTKTLVPLFI